MTTAKDPFSSTPGLRGRIKDPAESDYRQINLAALDEKMIKAGGPRDWRHSDGYREASRQKTLKGRLGHDLWVFGYGSLMWDPAFYFSEVRIALLQGYQRSFCIKSVLGRGTPEHPGLMAGLVPGGQCHGLAFCIDGSHSEEESRVIWQREMLLHAYEPKFIGLETAQGPIEALSFVVDPTAEIYLPGMSPEQTARYMATGAGVFGSSLDYLERLAEHFETLGIEDEALFQLLDLSRKIAAP